MAGSGTPSPVSPNTPANPDGGSSSPPVIQNGLTRHFDHHTFTAALRTISYETTINTITNFFVRNADNELFGPADLDPSKKAKIEQLAASTKYYLFLTRTTGEETSREFIWTDFGVENFRWHSVTRNDLANGAEFLDTEFHLHWKVQQGRNEAKHEFNPYEIYSLRGLSKDPAQGVVVELDYLKFDNLVVKWPIFEVESTKFWPDYLQYITQPLTYDLTNHPNLYFYLFKSRDISKFDAIQSQIWGHDIPTMNNMPMKHVFCKEIADFQCESVEVSKPELAQWQVQIDWHYLPQTEFKGYLIPDCKDHCIMDESWIGCRDSTEVVPKYRDFNSGLLGDVKIPSKYQTNAYNAAGAIKWFDRQSDPILVKMAKNSQNQVIQTTCYALIRSDNIRDKYGYNHMVDIFHSKIIDPHARVTLPDMFETNPIDVRFTKHFTNTALDWYKNRTKHECNNNLHVARYPAIDFKHRWTPFRSLFGIQYQINATAYYFMNDTATHTFTWPWVRSYSNANGNTMYMIGDHNIQRSFSGRSYDLELWITVNKTTFPLIDDSVKRKTQFLVPLFNNLDPRNYTFSPDGKNITITVPKPSSPSVNFIKATANFTDVNGHIAPSGQPANVTLECCTDQKMIFHISMANKTTGYNFFQDGLKFLSVISSVTPRPVTLLSSVPTDSISYEIPLYIDLPVPPINLTNVSGAEGMSAKFDHQLVGPNKAYMSASHLYQDYSYYYEVKDAVTKAVILPIVKFNDWQNFNTLSIDTMHQVNNFNYVSGHDYKLSIFKRYRSKQWPIDFWRQCITPDALAEKTVTVTLSLLGRGRKGVG